MVQAIENLTTLVGRIAGRSPHPTLAAYEVVKLTIDRTERLPEKADLLGPLVARAVSMPATLDLTVRRELIGDAPIGAKLRCRASRTPEGAMCEPHPAPEDFQVSL